MNEELEDWADRLEARASSTRFNPALVRVFETCGSTQDPARDLGIGSIVTTGRQSSGRGRLGRAWSEHAGAGVAISLGLPAIPARQACIAVAVASLEALRGALADQDSTDGPAERVGVKFPNDLVDPRSGRKIGGILVEVSGGLAVVGVGINVHRREWPPGIEGISLEELVESPGITRIEILERLLIEVDRAWNLPADRLDEAFADAHAPTGGPVEIGIGDETDASLVIKGRLVGLEPRRRLLVDTPGGREQIPVERARIISWTPTDPGRGGLER